MNFAPYPDWIDCVWLGSDRDGYLGGFITAGIGPIPLAALDLRRLVAVDVGSHLDQLFSVSNARLLVSVKIPDSYIALAERGLFVYDWTDVQSVYEAVAVPANPIIVSSLPDDLRDVANALRFNDLVFSEGEGIDVRGHFCCAESEVVKQDLLYLDKIRTPKN